MRHYHRNEKIQTETLPTKRVISIEDVANLVAIEAPKKKGVYKKPKMNKCVRK